MGKRHGLLIPFLIFFAIIAASGAIIITNLPAVLRMVEEIEKAEEPQTAEIERILYDKDGNEIICAVRIPTEERDALHAAAEAAIAPVPEETPSLTTLIPANTRLIGISGKDGYIYMHLSGDITGKDSKALEQIEKSMKLSFDFRELHFIINDEIIE